MNWQTMEAWKSRVVIGVVGLTFALFFAAAFGACGDNTQQLILDMIMDSRTQYIRVR